MVLLLSLHGCRGEGPPPLTLDAPTRVALAKRPAELKIADGRLHIHNLYTLQASILADSTPRTRGERIDRLVETVYRPYAEFWHGYLGDESDFRSWASALFDPAHPLASSLPALVRVNLDSLLESTASWLRRESGLDPVGRWYIVYGPGWTNMGGLGSLGMVADFSKQEVDTARLAVVLSHELAHQVHGARTADSDSGTVLERIVSEGLATYAEFVFRGDRGSPAGSLGYSDAEYAWAMSHEAELQAAANRILTSRDRADLDRVAARKEKLVAGGPGSAGYFLGFRIAAAFVERHGRDRWAELFRLPVREAVRRSGYALQVDEQVPRRRVGAAESPESRT